LHKSVPIYRLSRKMQKFKFEIRRASDGSVLAGQPYHVSQMPVDTLTWSTPQLNISALHGEIVYATVSLECDTTEVSQEVHKVYIEETQIQKMQSEHSQKNITLRNSFSPTPPIHSIRPPKSRTVSPWIWMLS